MGDRTHVFGVILAGGSGTRLWPLSTRDQPKQFLSLSQRPSFIRQTMDRLRAALPLSNIYVVGGAPHGERLRSHLSELPPEQILLEPRPKNTAPALALAAIHLRRRDPEALIWISPADHFIPPRDQPVFAEDLTLASEVAQREKALVTLGITPKHPATGFGYLERGEIRRLADREYFLLRAFHEKPDSATAKKYVESGVYYWNSGMFVWQAQTFMAQLAEHEPAMAEAFEALARTIGRADYPKTLQETFEKVENISVDYALMEKAQRVFMVPVRFEWDDVGNHLALARLMSCDGDNNNFSGKVFSLQSRDNLAVATTKPIALLGVRNMVVIESENAILVLPRERAEEVKSMVEYINAQGQKEIL